MALDELYERRLATVFAVFEDALDRIELLLKDAEQGKERGGANGASPAEIVKMRDAAGRIRARLQAAAARFEVSRKRTHWRQKLAAELARLWVVLENARPRRMKGYGRELAPQDRADWEALIRALLAEIEEVRTAVVEDTPGR